MSEDQAAPEENLFAQYDDDYESQEVGDLDDLADSDYIMELNGRITSVKDSGEPMIIWDATVTGPSRVGVSGPIYCVWSAKQLKFRKKEMKSLNLGHLKPSQFEANIALMQGLHAKVTIKTNRDPQFPKNKFINGLVDGPAPESGQPIADASNVPF